MGRHALAREMRPVRDLVRECFGDGGGREDADGGVRGREAVVEEGGKDLCGRNQNGYFLERKVR